jgi:crotonobetainyl-CoA:carnitine CoA-transferase CaiB-like acyl-CoA transferase
VGPLDGYRVLDVSANGAVPLAATILADWGADVLKVEDPAHGDVMRKAMVWGVEPPEGGSSFLYHVFNRRKRSIAINLKHPTGHRLLMELVDTADVFLTSYLSGTRERLGIDVEHVRERRPDIVYGRNTGRGTKGDLAEVGGFDATSFWGRSGLAAATTAPGQSIPTSMPAPGAGDCVTAFCLASGVVTALLNRERTGEGMVVDTSLLATGLWTMQTAVTGASLVGDRELRRPDRGVGSPLTNYFRTKDGRHIVLAMDRPSYWPSFCDAVGKPEWKTDPLLGTFEARAQNAKHCVNVLDELFEQRTLAEWKTILARQDGAFDPVQTATELATDPQVVANGYLTSIRDESGRDYDLVGPPVQFDEGVYDTEQGPEHGDSTDAVLAELGYDDEQVIQFKIDGAIH